MSERKQKQVTALVVILCFLVPVALWAALDNSNRTTVTATRMNP